MTRRFVAPIVIAAVAAIALAWRQWGSCRAGDRAVLLEFPQYARVRQGPERDEGGGCAVSYDTHDTPEAVRAYLIRQLTSHGWKVQPSDASRPDVGFSAMRGSFMYSVSSAVRRAASASNTQDSTVADTHVAIHVQDGVALADAWVDVELSSAATLAETREKAQAAGAAMERDSAWSDIMLTPLSLDVETSARGHQFVVRARTRTLPRQQRKVMDELRRRLSAAFP
jgi:hypothetical protein